MIRRISFSAHTQQADGTSSSYSLEIALSLGIRDLVLKFCFVSHQDFFLCIHFPLGPRGEEWQVRSGFESPLAQHILTPPWFPTLSPGREMNLMGIQDLSFNPDISVNK